jgi:hypothetical protein
VQAGLCQRHLADPIVFPELFVDILRKDKKNLDKVIALQLEFQRTNAVRYVPAKSPTFSPLSPQRTARKLHEVSIHIFATTLNTYLFFGVSTALMIREPFIPDSFT